MEIDVRDEIETFRFADGEPGENTVYLQQDYGIVVVNGVDKGEAEIHLEDVDNLIEALKQAKERANDGPDYPDGPWADGWEGRYVPGVQAVDASGNRSGYVSMTMNAADVIKSGEFDSDYFGIEPKKSNFEEAYNDFEKKAARVLFDEWIRHDGGKWPKEMIHPLDIVDNNYDTAAVAKDVGWDVVDRYRHVKDENGVPYVSNEGLEPWAEYVATDEDGCVSQSNVILERDDSDGYWFRDVHGKRVPAPSSFSNTFQHWTETLRRVWRK